jgi:hypothetical protein
MADKQITKHMKKIIFLALLFAVTLDTYAHDTTAKLLQAYYELKNALVADNASLGSEKAAAFGKAVAAVASADVNDTKVWQGFAGKLSADAKVIEQAKQLDKQREAFGRLSAQMAAMVKELKINHEEVYVQYCPMAKQSWLSESSSVKNPFYGKSMLTCGKVTDTLKGN